MGQSKQKCKKRKNNSNTDSDNNELVSSVLSEVNSVLYSGLESPSKAPLPRNLEDNMKSTLTPKAVSVNINSCAPKQVETGTAVFKPILINYTQYPVTPPPWATEIVNSMRLLKFVKSLKNLNRSNMRDYLIFSNIPEKPQETGLVSRKEY